MVADDDGKFFRAQSTAKDEAEQTLNSNSAAVGPVITPVSYDPLAVATPVATGTPLVGETLSCNEPEVTGGSEGPMQYGYYWVDETNAMIWERQYQSSQMVLTEENVGKTYKCLVTVTDKGWENGETVTVESNEIGPVVAPPPLEQGDKPIIWVVDEHDAPVDNFAAVSIRRKDKVTGTPATFTGGVEPYVITNNWQLSPDGSGSDWGTDLGDFDPDHPLEIQDEWIGGKIRLRSRCTDAQGKSKTFASAASAVIENVDDIWIKSPFEWDDSAAVDKYVGDEPYFWTTQFKGGTQDHNLPSSNRYIERWLLDGAVIHEEESAYHDHVYHHSIKLTEEHIGQLQYQASCYWHDQELTDTGEAITVKPKPTTIGTVGIKVNTMDYNWENPTTLTVLMNDDIDIWTTISGDANPVYKYTVRDTQMEYEIQPPLIDGNKDKGNGPTIVYIPKTEGMHVVSISIQDSTATDNGDNYPAVQLYAVDAKTWAELQAQK